jgi:hypothetical protein
LPLRNVSLSAFLATRSGFTLRPSQGVIYLSDARIFANSSTPLIHPISGRMR